jgi:hypothetical protein
MIQFTISSDPVGSEVMPEAEEDLEIDSKKRDGGLTVRLAEGNCSSKFLNISSLKFDFIIFNYSENHKEDINTLCGKNAELFLIVKKVAHKVVTML